MFELSKISATQVVQLDRIHAVLTAAADAINVPVSLDRTEQAIRLIDVAVDLVNNMQPELEELSKELNDLYHAQKDHAD